MTRRSVFCAVIFRGDFSRHNFSRYLWESTDNRDVNSRPIRLIARDLPERKEGDFWAAPLLPPSPPSSTLHPPWRIARSGTDCSYRADSHAASITDIMHVGTFLRFLIRFLSLSLSPFQTKGPRISVFFRVISRTIMTEHAAGIRYAFYSESINSRALW